MEHEVFLDMLGNTPSALVQTLDFERLDLSQSKRVGPGVPYALALIAQRHDESDSVYEKLLQAAWEDDEAPFSGAVGEDLARFYLKRERYADAEPVAALLAESNPDAIKIAKLHLETVYWQQKDEQVLELITRIRKLDMSALSNYERNEILLMEAAATARSGTEGWPELFKKLFRAAPLSKLHIRAYGFLSIDQNRSSHFGERELELFEGYSLAASGLNNEALDLLEPFLIRHEIDSSLFLEVVSHLYLRTGRFHDGIVLFTKLLSASSESTEPPTDDLRYILNRELGMLYRASKQYGNAIQKLEMAMVRTEEPQRAERMRWYIVDSARRISVEYALRWIERIESEIRNPGYFSDVFERLLTDAVAQRRWDLFPKLSTVLMRLSESYLRARISFVFSELLRYGLVAPDESASDSPEQLLSNAANTIRDSSRIRYYRILAGARLGKIPGETYPEGDGFSPLDTSRIRVGTGETQLRTDNEIIVQRLFELGLYLDSYDRITANPGEIPSDRIIETAERLSRSEHHTESMRLADLIIDDSEWPPGRTLVALAYPEAYDRLLTDAAGSMNLSIPLFQGIVREESFFNARVESHAGAIGLSQLMPATADDMASRMKISSPDLSDPEVNLKVGAYYLAYLIGLFDDVFHAVLAYNGGLGRVRRWVNDFGDLPATLFIEAIPIDETRDYARKILSATVTYGVLYHAIDAREALRILFPDFESD